MYLSDFQYYMQINDYIYLNNTQYLFGITNIMKLETNDIIFFTKIAISAIYIYFFKS
jgi:hypothetical protein